jgi:hypothetical protein
VEEEEKEIPAAGKEDEVDDGSHPMMPEGPAVRIGTGYFDKEKGAPVFQGLAEAKGFNQEKSTRIKYTSYSHEAMIDLIIANPRITQVQLAAEFGYSVSWVNRVIGSDAFQAALAERRREITDPFLVASVEERMRGLAMQSIDVIAEKLQATQSADIALKALDMTAKAMGFGARERGPAVQQNFVVQLPSKAASIDEWARAAENGAYRVIEGPRSEPDNFSTTVTHDPTVQPSPMKIVEE